MLEIRGIPLDDPLCCAILDKHVGRMLRLETVFAAQMVTDSTEWKSSAAREIRKALCPPKMKADRDRRRLIESLYTHLYAIDIVPVPKEERYTMARICGIAIRREESMIARITETKNRESLCRWLAHYRINDPAGRQYLLSACQNLSSDGFPGNRDMIGEREAELIRSCHKEDRLLPFEYPTVILMAFGDEELDTLAGMQPGIHI